MRVILGCLLIAFLGGTYNNLYAQAGLAGLHGKVTDEKHVAAEASTVILLDAADSSIIKSTSCDQYGLYKIDTKPGSYLLLVSRIGYQQSLTGPYILQKDENPFVPEITLQPSLPQLKEVSITALRSYIDIKPDRVTLNVQSSIISEGNSAIEILKQAPGTHVDSRGNISIIGHQNALVTIDGKPVQLTGQELADLLQSIPGNTIQQIELITSPSAKYEAAAGGIINIITKKGNNAGTNITVTAGAGYGKFYKANAGLNFNNRMGKINIFGGYNFSDLKTDHTFKIDRIIDYQNLISDYNSNYYATQQGTNHTFRIGTDYAITPNHNLGVLVSGTIFDYNYVKNNTLNITNNNSLDSVILTKANTNRGLNNISYDLNYTGRLDTSGKTLSADFVYNNITRHSSEYLDNTFSDATGTPYRPSLYLQNLSPSSIKIWASKIDYVNPISKTMQLEAGLKATWVRSNNDLVFGPKVNGVYQSSPAFSNTFNYDENINSAYITYTSKIDKTNLMFGLRAEQTNTSGKSVTNTSNVSKSYLDWFPQLQLDYKLDDKNDFNLNFNRGITRPAYEDVNPFLYYVDLYDYRYGNPNLLPQITNRLQLSHTYNKTFVTTLYASFVTDFYDLTNFTQNDSSKVSINTKVNFGTYTVYGLKFFTPVTFTNWWNATFSADVAYQRFKAYPQNGNLNKGTSDINLQSSQRFKINNTLSAELNGKYESPNFYGIGQFRTVYWVDAGISQQLFGKNGSLKLSVNDIFNTHRDQEAIRYQNLNMSVYDKAETRVIRLGFTYRFGNTALKAIMKHSAGNEDEQKRAGGGVAGNVP